MLESFKAALDCIDPYSARKSSLWVRTSPF